MRHFHGLRLRAIAEILNTSETSIKNSLFRTTHKLRSHLAAYTTETKEGTAHDFVVTIANGRTANVW